MNVYVYTLGCRVNQCESEGMIQSFVAENWTLVKNYEEANLIVINTCTVTSKAEQKARRMIRLFAEVCPVIITGCYTDSDLQKVSERIILVPIFAKSYLLDMPSYLTKNALPGTEMNEDYLARTIRDYVSSFPLINAESAERKKCAFSYNATDFSLHSRSFLKIEDGCDNACAFCRTRIARGPSVFLEEDEVVRRALELEKSGYHEIVLTGINLTMYNHRGGGLGSLLEKLLSALGGDMRLRLSSMEADNVDDRCIDCLKDKRMQPYFHIPVQSGSDRVLERVNRNCRVRDIERIVEKISLIRDNPLFACDVITGLPSETDEDFNLTIDFLVRNNFNLFHVFPFSPRRDTPLYNSKDRVSESVRDERAKTLRELSERRYSDYVKSWVGREAEVIIEGLKQEKDGRLAGEGLTGNYIRTRVNNAGAGTVIGDLKKVILVSSGESVLCE